MDSKNPRPGDRAKPPRRPSKRGEKRIEAIVAAAEKLFLDKGFEGASLDEVARLANASKATIYAYYKNKVGLFRAIINVKVSAVFGAIDAAERVHLPLDQALHALGRAFLTLMLSPVGLKFYRLIVSQGTEFPDLAATWYENGPTKAIGAVANLLRARAAAGEITVDDPDQAAEFFLMMLRGTLQLRAVTGLAKAPFETAIAAKVNAATALFLKSLAYRPPAASSRRRSAP